MFRASNHVSTLIHPSLKRSIKNIGYRLVYGPNYNPKRYWLLRGLTYKRDFYKRYQEQGNVKRDNLALVVKTLESLSLESFLEVGCGYGLCLQYVQNVFPSIAIHGCDISCTQLLQARRFLGPKSTIVLKETDGVTLPYPDKSFDVAFTYGVCIHVPAQKIEGFISEIIRVTRKHYIFIESSTGNDSFYYFSHDYDKVFTKLGIKLTLIKELVPANKERLYAVDLT